MKIEFTEHEKAVANGLNTAACNLVPAAGEALFGIGKIGAKLAWGIAKTAYSATKATVNAASDAVTAYQADKSVKPQEKPETVIDAEVVG